ncbi:protein kinase [Spirillospora sp. NPDC052269]
MPDGGMLNGRYRIVDRLGSGGMGSVWRADDELLGREVAVKEILLPHGLDETALAAVRARALAEARAAARVRHNGVVTIYDVVIEDGHPWIVMELVRARSLDDRIREEGALSVAETARIGAALADALRAVHALGIVHRDLKPANVLLEPDGHVVLTDFGIATIDGDLRLTASGLLIGTPGFMAPERLAGEPSGPPSDLWCLGAVLYSAVEGRPPFKGTTPAMVAAAVLTGAPAQQTRSGTLKPLITALLERDPAARPDASEISERLKAVRPDAPGPKTRADPQPSRTPAAPVKPRPQTPRLLASVPPTAPAAPQAAAKGRRIGATPQWIQAERTSSPAVPPSVFPGGRIGCLVALAVAIALLAGLWALPSSHSDDSVDPVNSVDPASLGPAIDPCQLVSDVRLRSLGLVIDARDPTPFEDEKHGMASCNWRAKNESSPSVTIEVMRYPDDETAFREFLSERRDRGSAFVPKGVGDEARGFSSSGTSSIYVMLRFRRGKRVVSVTLNNAPRIEAGTQVAKWADTEIQKYH